MSRSERLVEADLATQMGIPAREALWRLAFEGFVGR
jgi:hypothetical protein